MRVLLVIFVVFVGGVLLWRLSAPYLVTWMAQEAVSSATERSDAELERVLGKDAAQNMRGKIQRLSRIAGMAVACELRDQQWSDRALKQWNDDFLAWEINHGIDPVDAFKALAAVLPYVMAPIASGAAEGAERKRVGTCSALKGDPDLYEADRLAVRGTYGPRALHAG